MDVKFKIPLELNDRVQAVLSEDKYRGGNMKFKVIQLQCINPKGCKHLKLNEIYYGWRDYGQKAWYNGYEEYDVYKIIHPVLGPRKYDPKRFIIIREVVYY